MNSAFCFLSFLRAKVILWVISTAKETFHPGICAGLIDWEQPLASICSVTTVGLISCTFGGKEIELVLV